MDEKFKQQLLKHLKTSFAILLIVYVLLNLLFFAMGKINVFDFWVSLGFVSIITWFFYKKNENQKKKTIKKRKIILQKN